MIEAIPIKPTVRITVTAPITKLCPFRDEVDHGTVTFLWWTYVSTYELHSVAEYLASFAERSMTHEEITQQISDEFHSDVTTNWHTAGLSVEVRCCRP